jgi:hypothetical protein
MDEWHLLNHITIIHENTLLGKWKECYRSDVTRIFSDKFWLLPLKVYDCIECYELILKGYIKLWLTAKTFEGTKETSGEPAMLVTSLINLGFHPPKIRPPAPFPYHVKNEDVLLRVKEKRSMPQTINKRKATWSGHILCRNCLLKTCYWRKDRGKKWKMTFATTGWC